MSERPWGYFSVETIAGTMWPVYVLSRHADPYGLNSSRHPQREEEKWPEITASPFVFISVWRCAVNVLLRRETLMPRAMYWRLGLKAIISLFFPHNMSADNNYIFILRGRRKVVFCVDQMRRKQALGPDRVTINWLLIHHLPAPELGSVSPEHTPNFPQMKTFQSRWGGG